MFKTLTLILIGFVLILFVSVLSDSTVGFCEKDEYAKNEGKCRTQHHYSKNRYILYDVNPPEGFNLRRDVYVRVAVFLKNLIEKNTKYQWFLVLPPWGNLYHWRSESHQHRLQIPWNQFFDINSLQKYVPVIDMYTFIKEYPSENGHTKLDCVYVLQNDEEMFKSGNFHEKNELVPCPKEKIHFKQINSEECIGYFWGYQNITSKDLKCLNFHGMMSDLEQNLKPDVYTSVVFDHIEIPLHDDYGSYEYWKARRSMRYNLELYKIASEYRKIHLNSYDEKDNTKRPEDWTLDESERGAVGGPYLSVHLRRRDFLVGHSATTPSIMNAAQQLQKKLDNLGLNTLFVATDAENEEFEELKSILKDYNVLKYEPSKFIKNKFKDGGIAIIEQIICSYARYFIGTYESTFTYRIQEDREIIGFPTNTTFNTLCKNKKKCLKGGRWEIVWS